MFGAGFCNKRFRIVVMSLLENAKIFIRSTKRVPASLPYPHNKVHKLQIPFFVFSPNCLGICKLLIASSIDINKTEMYMHLVR